VPAAGQHPGELAASRRGMSLLPLLLLLLLLLQG
jgi:hypothetical protein